MHRLIVSGMLALSPLLSWGQAPGAFVGNWIVTWQGDKRQIDARLVITPSGGTWKVAVSAKFDNCAGKEAPIQIEEVSADSAKIHLKYSEVVPGCADGMIRIRKLNENQMIGFRADKELRITRE